MYFLFLIYFYKDSKYQLIDWKKNIWGKIRLKLHNAVRFGMVYTKSYQNFVLVYRNSVDLPFSEQKAQSQYIECCRK